MLIAWTSGGKNCVWFYRDLQIRSELGTVISRVIAVGGN
jgi:hypothetical protein